MLKKKLKHWGWGYLFVAPTMIGLLILNIWPIIETFLLSFQKSLGFNRYEFAGFENFAKLFSDADVWIGLKNTFIFALVSVPLGIFLSL